MRIRVNDITNITELKAKINEELDRTTWWMLSDSQLSEHQLDIATEWRADMMAVTSLESFTALRSEFIRLVSIKPNWSI